MDDFRGLLDIYSGVLEEHLTPSAIIPHLAYTLNDETIETTVYTAERRDRREACQILLSALKESCVPGIFRGFLEALRAAEFGYLADMLEGHTRVQDETVFKNLLKIFYPVLYKDVNPADIMPSLVESQCITREDEERLVAVQHSSGRSVAILSLLTTVVRQQPRWFPRLMAAMKNGGYEHIVQRLLGAENLEDMERIAEKFRESYISPMPDTERYAKCKETCVSTHHEYQQLEHSVSCPEGSPGASGSPRQVDFRRPADRSQEWFHGNLSRENSRKLILDYGTQRGDGTFLVRRSSSPDHPYTLVVYVTGEVYHVPIRLSRQGGDQLVLGREAEEKKVYACLSDLINGYKYQNIRLATSEGEPLEGSVLLQSSPPKTVPALYENLK